MSERKSRVRPLGRWLVVLMVSTQDGLEKLARTSAQSEGFTPRLVSCRARVIAEYTTPGKLLDLGCGDGLLTAELAKVHERVVAVDASETRVERTRDRCPAAEVVSSLILDYRTEERFDTIILSCVLQQVADPLTVLEHAYSLLEVGGRIVVIVPHARSIHRRAGVHMGKLASLDEPGLTGDGLREPRVYEINRLRTELIEARFEILDSGGLLFKPAPNAVMATMPSDLVDAYERLGRESPDIAAEIFSIGLRRM